MTSPPSLVAPLRLPTDLSAPIARAPVVAEAGWGAVAGPTRDPEFEALFHELYASVLASVQRFVSARPAAEDIAAEAFARAYARWPHVQTLAWRDAWVMRVAINLAIDSTRKRRLPRQVIDTTTFDDATVDRVALARAMKRLPARQRDVVAMRYLADLSEQQVATALGISTGSVKTHLSRGLERLRSELDARPEHEGGAR